MQRVKKALGFLAKNFVFFVGIIFIFVFGFLYAYVKPQGIIFNGVFLLIVIGWVIFMIRYFWELMEKDGRL